MTLFESFHLISFLRNQSELVQKCQCCSEHTKHCCKISKQTCILFSFSTSMYWIRLMYKYKWVIICIFFLAPTRADKHTTYRWHAAALSILCALSSVLSAQCSQHASIRISRQTLSEYGGQRAFCCDTNKGTSQTREDPLEPFISGIFLFPLS